eukprot:jgi/Botrbrau1/17222/Bobra.0799s0005.1
MVGFRRGGGVGWGCKRGKEPFGYFLQILLAGCWSLPLYSWMDCGRQLSVGSFAKTGLRSCEGTLYSRLSTKNVRTFLRRHSVQVLNGVQMVLLVGDAFFSEVCCTGN